MCRFADNQKNGAGRNGRQVFQQREIHHGHAAGHGELGYGIGVIAAHCGVELAKFAPDGVGYVVKTDGSATRGHYRSRAFKLCIALLCDLVEKVVAVCFGGAVLPAYLFGKPEM